VILLYHGVLEKSSVPPFYGTSSNYWRGAFVWQYLLSILYAIEYYGVIEGDDGNEHSAKRGFKGIG
jgi:hypothetical protein